MSESLKQSAVREALKTLLGGAGTALGYDFVNNPQSFVLAVLWQEVRAVVQEFANATAARAYSLWLLAEQSVIDPLAFALGAPGRLLASMTFDLLDYLDGLAVDLANALGPLGFIAAPVVWSVTVVVAVSVLVGIWRLYKWLRVVVA